MQNIAFSNISNLGIFLKLSLGIRILSLKSTCKFRGMWVDSERKCLNFGDVWKRLDKKAMVNFKIYNVSKKTKFLHTKK